jgi:type IV secretory pathway TraG/TraD family ATPase VirD4
MTTGRKIRRSRLVRTAFHGSNVSDSYEGVDLITTDLLMAMQPGTQIVLVQNFMNQPVSLEGIRYWDDPVISVRTHNIKNPAASVGPPPAAPMPEWTASRRSC